MLAGWHVDSNIAVRLRLFYGRIADAVDGFFAYHCDHTRQMTPAHLHERKENSFKKYVEPVTTPYLPEQATIWGCPGLNIEETRLDGVARNSFIGSISRVVGAPLKEPYRAQFSTQNFDLQSYDSRHVTPFLVDLFFAMPRDLKLAWFGERTETVRLFRQVWKQLGFKNEIMIAADNGFMQTGDGLREVAAPTIFDEADACIFEFSSNQPGSSLPVTRFAASALLEALMNERTHTRAGVRGSRRYVGLNAVNTSYEGFFCGFVAARSTPFSGRMRHGFAFEFTTGPQNWLPALKLGPSGQSIDAAIENRPGEKDWICYGPYKTLLPGTYRLVVDAGRLGEGAPANAAFGIIELIAGPTVIAVRHLTGPTTIDFLVTLPLASDNRSLWEVRIKSLDGSPIYLSALSVEALSDEAIDDPQPSFIAELRNIADFLAVGSFASRQNGRIVAEAGQAGHICSGPYWGLPAKSYMAEFTLNAALSGEGEGKLVFEILGPNDHFLVRMEVFCRDLPKDGRIIAPFTVENAAEALEFRVWTDGTAQIELSGLIVSEA